MALVTVLYYGDEPPATGSDGQARTHDAAPAVEPGLQGKPSLGVAARPLRKLIAPPGVEHLTVGTDCSGMDMPIIALEHLGIPYRHVFASEVDPTARRFILDKFTPEHIYGDIRERGNEKAPHVDLYVAGFSCQPFPWLAKDLAPTTPPGGGTSFGLSLSTLGSAGPRSSFWRMCWGSVR